jgi:hypothetical protein
MLEGRAGMAATSFFEVSSPNRDSENFLRKKRYCNLQEIYKKMRIIKKKGTAGVYCMEEVGKA